jgi:O-antigen/teichoic acid export membrane protein
MSFSSLFPSILIWILLRKINNDSYPSISLLTRDVIKEQWNYSKWATGVTILFWINSFIAIPSLGIIIGIETSGLYRGLQNIILPLQQIGAALGNTLVPWFSAQDHTNKRKIRNLSIQIIFGFSLLGIAYLAPILLFPEKILLLLYDEVQINYNNHEVRLIGVVGFISIIIACLSYILQAQKKPNGIFWANCIGSLFSIIVTIPLILSKGLLGAIEGSIVTLTVILIILFYHFSFSFTMNNPLSEFKGKYEKN